MKTNGLIILRATLMLILVFIAYQTSANKEVPVITWANPADIVYGTPLSAIQLNATANTTGTFAYTPDIGVILNAGTNQELSVLFTPDDLVNFEPASKIVTINVLKATPVITWSNPADIIYQTVLSAAQLNAAASTTGTFSYTPTFGTLLNAGLNQELLVLFTPSNENNYYTAEKTVQINVHKATPVITWVNPNDINYGVLLSSTQMNATVNTTGTFTYNPIINTLLKPALAQTLSVSFAPSDPLNWNPASKSVSINVHAVTPIYVKPQSEGTGSGVSWSNAINSIQEAINLFDNYPIIAEIRITAGTYNGGITVKSGISINGGYTGTGDTRILPDEATTDEELTILDGQNTQRVISQGAAFANPTIFDGLVIRNGNSTAGGGAYLYANATISNSFIENNTSTNHAGGVYLNQGGTLEHCRLYSNVADKFGGAVYCNEGGTVTHSDIRNNSATNAAGVCLMNGGTVLNSYIANNSAVTNCGGVYFSEGGTLVNSTIVRNQAGMNGGGIVCLGTNIQIANNIIWGNNTQVYLFTGATPTITYCGVQGGLAGTGNFELSASNADGSRFATTSDAFGANATGWQEADWRLTAASKCINKGDPQTNSEGYAVQTGTTDILGSTRLQNGLVDIGAFERGFGNFIYVMPTTTGDSTGGSWNSAMSLQNAVDIAEVLIPKPEVRVAKGIYYGGFFMRDGVNVYGGYTGVGDEFIEISSCETNSSQTIFDGNNTNKVLLQVNSIIQNIVIQNGNATLPNGAATDGAGAVLLENGKLINCIVKNNSGAYNGGGVLGGSVINSYILNNSASNGGGASGANIINCKVFNNSAGERGGGVHKSKFIVNSVIYNNSSGSIGGGVFLFGSSISSRYIINTVIVNNFAGYNAGGIYADWGVRTSIVNTILWGNNVQVGYWNTPPTLTFSAIQNGYEGVGNINLPSNNYEGIRFYKPSNGIGVNGEGWETADWRLMPLSDGINTGDPLTNDYEYEIQVGEVDLDGNPRIKNDRIDIGAYETIIGEYLYVNTASIGDSTGYSFNNAVGHLQWAVDFAERFNVKPEIRVTTGTYLGAFTMRDGVNVTGGYTNDDSFTNPILTTSDEQRSILNGEDLARVLLQPDVFTTPTTWKGFAIRNGNAPDGAGVSLRVNGHVTNSLITNNHATWGAGGVYLYQGGNVSNSIISNNEADLNGAGIYFNAGGNAWNNLISNNTASDGGGVYMHSGGALYNNTIVHNDGYTNGGGAYLRGANTSSANNIIWGNNSQVYLYSGATPTITYSGIQGGYAGTGNINLAANNVDGVNFKQPALGVGTNGNGWNTANWELNSSSTCNEVGDPQTNSFGYSIQLGDKDIRNKARIINSRVDLGAYETLIPQQITWLGEELGVIEYNRDTIKLTAINNSPLDVLYTTNNQIATSLSNDTVFVVGAGTATISATQPGNDYYDAAIPVDYNLTITPRELTIAGSFSVLDKDFDGSNLATIDENNLTLEGVLEVDEVELDNIITVFSQIEVGENIPVSIQSAELIGHYSAGYELSLQDAPTTFASIYLPTYTLTLNIEGSGVVYVNEVPYTNALTVDMGTLIDLEAEANEGWQFIGWSGDLLSANPLQSVLMNANKSITALFTIINSVETTSTTDLSVYPNPFVDEIKVQTRGNVNRISIVTVTGQVVCNTNTTGQERETINVSHLSSGVYMLILHLKNGNVVTRKIVKK